MGKREYPIEKNNTQKTTLLVGCSEIPVINDINLDESITAIKAQKNKTTTKNKNTHQQTKQKQKTERERATHAHIHSHTYTHKGDLSSGTYFTAILLRTKLTN